MSFFDFSLFGPKDPESEKISMFRKIEQETTDLEEVMALKTGWLVERGNKSFGDDKLDLAEQDFREAMQLDSHCSVACLALVNLLREKRMFQEALKVLESTPEIPTGGISVQFDLYLNIGLVNMDNGDTLKAIEYLQKALDVHDEWFCNLPQQIQAFQARLGQFSKTSQIANRMKSARDEQIMIGHLKGLIADLKSQPI